MGRLWVSDFVYLRNLAWNLRLACWAGRHGDWGDRSIGAGYSPAPSRFCGEQELCGMEPFRHFGPHRDCEYRGARPAARSQFLRSCYNGSYDTAAAGAGSNIFSANVLDTALDCAVSGATSRQISNPLLTQESHTGWASLGEAAQSTPVAAQFHASGPGPAARRLGVLCRILLRRSFRKKSPNDMAFPHPQSRKEHHRNEDIPSWGA